MKKNVFNTLKCLLLTSILTSSAMATGDTQAEPMLRDIETGYLLNCNFRAIRAYCYEPAVPPLTGWETDRSGGIWESQPSAKGATTNFGFHVDWFRLRDTSPDKAVTIKHQVARQSKGVITLEFRFGLSQRMDGAAWELRDMNDAFISIAVKGENLCYRDTSGDLKILQAYSLDQSYGVKIQADMDRKRFDIFVDGKAAALDVPFLTDAKTLDYVLVTTGDKATGSMYLNPVNIYKGYNLCETFVTSGTGLLPAPWTANRKGTASVEEFRCSSKPDFYSIKLVGGKAACPFPQAPGKAVVCFRTLIPKRADCVVELGDTQDSAFSVITKDKNIYLMGRNGKYIPLIKNYLENLWYDFKLVIDQTAGKADVSINGKLIGEGLHYGETSTRIGNITFGVRDKDSTMWADDIMVYPWRDYPADYVPKPVLTSSKDHCVGVISCSLWKEGDSYAGWDYIYTHKDKRRPYLGWYDEGNPEVADWEIKWQVENGIDFEQYCWYRPNDAIGYPIKDGVLEHGIRDGLFNAKYSHLKKFTIMYTNQGAGVTNMDDWQKHIIPYWIEYFFKDPRYLKVDNKPVLAIYYLDQFLVDFKGQKKAGEAIKYLKDACRVAGFDGCTVIMEDRCWASSSERLSHMKAIGVDYCFAYTWGTNSTEQQQGKMKYQKTIADRAGLGVLPSASVGWDKSAWYGKPGTKMVPVDQFSDLLKWTKDEYMPSLPEDSLGRKLLLIPNWNEFGEGHFIMPSAYAGFGYLDAIRNTFTKGRSEGGEYRHLVPTEKQLKRISVLYPRSH